MAKEEPQAAPAVPTTTAISLASLGLDVDDDDFDADESMHGEEGVSGGAGAGGVSADGGGSGGPSTGGGADGKKADAKKLGKPSKTVLKGCIGANKPSKMCSRLCRGCKKWFSPEGMSLSKNFCHRDNRALDNIRHCAKKQGKMDWLSRIRSDESKLVLVIKEYNARFPDTVSECGSKRKKTASSATYQMLESVIASTKVIRETEGEMMWEKEYVEFAQTKSGGALTDDAARTEWQKWVEMMRDGSLRKGLQDQGGPAWSPLRFWVKTRDRVLFQESIEKQKQLRIADKELSG